MNEDELPLLRRLVPLNTLPEAELRALVESLDVIEVEAGALLFAAGDTDTGHVYLLSGKVELLADDLVVDVIVAGATTARFPLAHRFPRQYTARARGDVRYVVVAGHLLGSLLEKDRREALRAEADEGDTRVADWIGKLLQSRVFQAVPKDDLHMLLRRMEVVEVPAGDVLIEEGAPGDYFYLLDRGEAEVRRGESRLALLSSGDMFGEEALLADTPRGATVRMRTDGVLLRLDRDSFRRLVRLPALCRCDVSRANQLLASGCLLLDVRVPGAFADGHRIGAINLPLESLRYQISSLSRERCYVVCGESLDRALIATYLLTDRGFDAIALDGSGEELGEVLDSDGRSEQGGQAVDSLALHGDLRLAFDHDARIADLNSRLEAANRRCAELEKERDALRAAQPLAGMARGARSQDSAEQQNKALKAQTDALQAELTLLRRLESEAREDAARARAENARLQAELRARELPIAAPSAQAGQQRNRDHLDLIRRLEVAESQLQEARDRLRSQQRQRDREVTSLSDRIALLERQLADSGRAILDASSRYEEAERAYRQRIAEYRERVASDDDQEAARVDQEKLALMSRVSELEAAERERDELREQLSASGEEAAELRTVIENSLATIDALKAELAMVRERADEDLRAMSAELEALRGSGGDAQGMQVELEGLRQELNEARKVIRERDEALDAAHDERQFLEDSLEDRDRDLDEAGGRIAELEERLREIETRLAGKDDELADLESALRTCQQECEAIQAADYRDSRLDALAIERGARPSSGGRMLLGLLIGAALVAVVGLGVWRAGLLPAPSIEADDAGRPVDASSRSPHREPRYLPARGGPLSPGAVRDWLADGSLGPPMRQLSGSLFQMGSDAPWAPPNARPRHAASIGGFWIAEREVTIAEYRRFARATGRRLPLDVGWSGDDLPVSGVSWEDADAYVTWLSRQTGHHYRLPSESEWEYAAAAGATTRYWWGDEPRKGLENCAGCGTRWDDRQPAPVASLSANGFGLYDMLGNVMEWVEDCYRSDYQVPLSRADCRRHVYRGGSFHRPLAQLFIVARRHGAPDLRSPYLGFRVARDDY